MFGLSALAELPLATLRQVFTSAAAPTPTVGGGGGGGYRSEHRYAPKGKKRKGQIFEDFVEGAVVELEMQLAARITSTPKKSLDVRKQNIVFLLLE